MAVLSKEIFYQIIVGKTCSDFSHPTIKTCHVGIIDFIFRMCQGTAKFCLAIALLQIIVKGKNIKKENLKSTFIYCTRLFCCGVSMGALFLASICLQSKFFGRFYYYTIVTVPGFLSASSIFLVPATKRYIFITSVCCAAVDTVTRALGMRYIFKKTIFFMLFNSLFMYRLQLWKTSKRTSQDTPQLWFFSPHHSSADENYNERKLERPCSHVYSCVKSIVKESSKYFWCGAVIESARIVIINFNKIVKNPKAIWGVLFRKSNLQLAVFAAIYVFLHKVTNCMLCRFYGKSKNSNALIAGFISGLAFYVRPSIAVSTTVFVNLIHIFWRHFNCNENLLRNFPTSEFLFVVCFAYLVHNRFFNADNTSTFFIRLLSLASNGRSDMLMDNLTKIVENHKAMALP